MSAANQDSGASLAARTVAAATAAAKQLGMVLGLAQKSPFSQVPPSPPCSIATALKIEGLEATIDEKKGNDCERKQEGAAALKDRGSEPVEVKPADDQVKEEKEKKPWKDSLNKGNPFPRRPGERDCSFFVRTGKCGYGQDCKFNHPPDRWKKNKAQRQSMQELSQVSSGNVVREDKERRKVEKLKCKNFASPQGCKYGNTCHYAHYVEKVEAEIELNFLGLPIRPGEKECALYMETATCKDSTNCKYHHPNPTAIDGSNQPSEFSSSSSNPFLPDYDNASWGLESTSYGLHQHQHMDTSFLHLQGMPAMHQVPPSNNDWHAYQASIDPFSNNGPRQNLAVPASEVAVKQNANGKDHPDATNDCKGNEEFLLASTPASMTEGRGGGKHPQISAFMDATKSGWNTKHRPISNANNATPKKGSGKHTPDGGVGDTNKGKRTGKMSTSPHLYKAPEATKGKVKERQSPSANPNKMTKSTGVDKLVSIPKFVPKEKGKEQPPVSDHNDNTGGMASKNETVTDHEPKGSTENGKKPQGGIQYDGTNLKEYEEQPIKGRGDESNPTKKSGSECSSTKSEKNVKHSPVATAYYVPKGKTKQEHPVSTNHDDSGAKGNGNQHAVATPVISANAKNKTKHPPVTTSHDFKNPNPSKVSFIDFNASENIIYKNTSGKPPYDVILSDATERTDDT